MRTILRLSSLIPTESDEQAMLFQWARAQRYHGYSLSELMVAIPNGASLAGDKRQRAIQMARLKREGLKPGASDVFVAIPKRQFAGLWVEMKRTQLSITSEEQLAFQARMIEMGYAATIAKGFEEARAAIEAYLQ